MWSPLLRVQFTARPPIGLSCGPRLGLLGYLLSSFSCAFFALAARAALGGSLGSCYRPAALPLPGLLGGCPVRVYRWDYWRHLPVSSLGPLCRESVNLSTLVGLFRGFKRKKGGFYFAARGWLWPWLVAGLRRSGGALPCITAPCEALWGTAGLGRPGGRRDT